MSENKTLYWVKFTDQDSGNDIDEYVLADSLSHLDEQFAEIREVKVIKGIIEL